MKIAFIGYGKMGRAIEELALAKGHEIVLRICTSNPQDLTRENIQKADVCIEFSTPEAAFHHVTFCLECGVPVVCGTTAWTEHLETVQQLCRKQNGSFLFASNFSLGVNLFFRISEWVAHLMQAYPSYKVSMEEIHHTQKKDAPSGTAITLAEGILNHYPGLKNWKLEEESSPGHLPIRCKREDPAPGTHSIRYDSSVDQIELIHTAHNRKGFAEGALLAAEFICNRKGIFTMRDVLGLP